MIEWSQNFGRAPDWPTGHCLLNSHLHRIGQHEKACMVDETVLYFILVCPKYSGHRERLKDTATEHSLNEHMSIEWNSRRYYQTPTQSSWPSSLPWPLEGIFRPKLVQSLAWCTSPKMTSTNSSPFYKQTRCQSDCICNSGSRLYHLRVYGIPNCLESKLIREISFKQLWIGESTGLILPCHGIL